MDLQFFGEMSGAVTHKVLLCIDEDLPHEFMITVIPDEGAAFAVIAYTDDGSTNPIHLKPRNLLRPQQNGGLIFPRLTEEEITSLKKSEITLNRKEDGGFVGTWNVEDKKGEIELHKLPEKSAIQAEVLTTWADFKTWASQASVNLDAAVFRGHGSNRFELKTTLHRVGRTRLDRYCNETLVKFHSEVEAELGMRLNMNDGGDYSVVLGLAQHHGLPTPMLDWTTSPYIAAFFAFSDALDATHRTDETHVRVFALSRDFVDETSPENVVLTWPRPFASSLKISPRHNDRLRAQQGRFLVTNVSNLGSWLQVGELRVGKRFLHAVDVPISCAKEALEDLAFMGLSAATMFPGLDGVSRAIRHEMAFSRPQAKPPGLPASGQSQQTATAPSSPPVQE